MPRRNRLFPALLALAMLIAPASLAAQSHLDWTQPCSTELPFTDDEAREILATERPFAPTDRDLFYSSTHPDWADMPPPPVFRAEEPTEDEVRNELRRILEARFSCSPHRVAGGLAVLDDPVAIEKIPDARLRAALAALTGTIGEPAIRFALETSEVESIHFGVGTMPGRGLDFRYAFTSTDREGELIIVIDLTYRHVHFAALAPILFHELLHAGDNVDPAGEIEETIAFSLQALVYMELLLVEPDLALSPDILTWDLNNRTALVRLNSAPMGDDGLTVLVPESDVPIDPTRVESVTQFSDLYAAESAPTEDEDWVGQPSIGNELLRTVLQRLAEPGERPPDEADFDDETLEFVDRNHAPLTAAELVTVACILRLDAPCE